MAAVNTIASQRFLPRPRPRPRPLSPSRRVLLSPASTPLTTTTRSSRITPPRPDQHRGARRDLAVASVAAQDLDVLPVKSSDSTDQPGGVVLGRERDDIMGDGGGSHVGGFAFESGGVGDVGGGAGLSPSPSPPSMEEGDFGRVVDRTINATLVLAAGTFAITRLLTIDSDYWHGWTIYEILRYAPLHNWTAYEEALRTNPVLAKMMISGVVYSVGDWIAQCYEGKPLLDLDRTRMFRSGLVGFTLHGSLSHYYYQFCEALFPFHDWWVVPAKVAFDQTAWAALWNSIYYVVLGFLRFESPANIFKELRATFWPMLTAGWKLWPFAHLITYGAIPVEQRLLWVDCVELVWVTILSTYSNEKSEARNTGAMAESNTKSPSAAPEESMK